LFVVANDLTQLKIRILVDEADIGDVRENQNVKFTVDAFPDEEFTGRIQEVRKQPVVTQNVTSYEVIALAANPDRKLLPGMTCNADIVTEEYPDVLVAPLAGTRWRPANVKPDAASGASSTRPQAGAQAAGGGQGFGGGGGQRRNGGGGGFNGPEQFTAQLSLDAKQKTQIDALIAASRAQRQTAIQSAGDDRAARGAAMRKLNEQLFTDIGAVLRPDQKTKLAALRAAATAARGAGGAAATPRVERTVYLLKNNKPSPVKVMTGANDGTWVEVFGDALKIGDQVITGGGAVAKATPQRTGAAVPGAGFGGGGFGGGGFGGGGGGGGPR
jgi:HlyD family secretion protein